MNCECKIVYGPPETTRGSIGESVDAAQLIELCLLHQAIVNRLQIPNRVVVGDVLVGFCAGHFGRDGHGDKTIEAMGKDWIVVRYGVGGLWEGGLGFASGDNVSRELWKYCKRNPECKE